MVNVIIPTFKARETLPKTLDSLVCQTKDMFIVTIVQDCDGEDYSDIVEEYSKRGLHISLICTPENGGPGMARQFGMDNTKMCDYVMFCDSDDLLHAQAIEMLYREAKREMADIAMSDMVAEVPYTTGRYFPAQTTPVQWCGGKIYRLQYLRENDIRFLPELRLNEDSYFNLVAWNGTEKRIKIAKETYLWRYNKNSLTRNEENGNFFQKSWIQYIKSQVYGLRKLYSMEKPVDVNLTAATILNIYTHLMQAYHLNMDMQEIPKIYEELFKINGVVESFSDGSFWKYINDNLKSSRLEENLIWFFKYRFIDWFSMAQKGEV